jgi:hypothetical protein
MGLPFGFDLEALFLIRVYLSSFVFLLLALFCLYRRRHAIFIFVYAWREALDLRLNQCLLPFKLIAFDLNKLSLELSIIRVVSREKDILSLDLLINR